MRQSLVLLTAVTVVGVAQSFAPLSQHYDSAKRISKAAHDRVGSVHSSFMLPQSNGGDAAVLDYSSQFFEYMDDAYVKSSKIKCPFFRRRAADLIDGTASLGRFLLVRHKSLPYVPPGCQAMATCKTKHTGLSTNQILETIQRDWKTEKSKGYYITGRLNTTIYRNDCLFSGPDPDMPVKGLRKYLGAASHLFDTSKSSAKLFEIDILDKSTIVAHWELQGVLMLPWRPEIPPWRGSTTYHLDQDGLVYHHEEMWDKSVLQAFVTTVFPEIGQKIWNDNEEEQEEFIESV